MFGYYMTEGEDSPETPSGFLLFTHHPRCYCGGGHKHHRQTHLTNNWLILAFLVYFSRSLPTHLSWPQLDVISVLASSGLCRSGADPFTTYIVRLIAASRPLPGQVKAVHLDRVCWLIPLHSGWLNP